jgi:hypothetical protein
VGLPKTGSTAIQEYFKNYSSVFLQHGITGLANDGLGSHTELAKYLLMLDNGNIENIGLGHFIHNNFDLPLIQDESFDPKNGCSLFPSFENCSKIFISSEHFHELASLGAQCVVDYALQNQANLSIMAVVRPPQQWIWSVWGQYIKSHWIDWYEFLEYANTKKIGFLSNILSPWIGQSNTCITLLEYNKKTLISDLFVKLGVPISSIKNSASIFIANKSLDPIGIVYQALLNKNILDCIAQMKRNKIHEPSSGYISTLLLDFSNNSSATHEISSLYRHKILQEQKVFGVDTSALLSTYTQLWIEDALHVLNIAKDAIDGESKQQLKNVIDQAIESKEACQIKSFKQDELFPNRDFINHLPINAQFIGLGRCIATTILLGSRFYKA